MSTYGFLVFNVYGFPNECCPNKYIYFQSFSFVNNYSMAQIVLPINANFQFIYEYCPNKYVYFQSFSFMNKYNMVQIVLPKNMPISNLFMNVVPINMSISNPLAL